jgi:hypothetical protein
MELHRPSNVRCLSAHLTLQHAGGKPLSADWTSRTSLSWTRDSQWMKDASNCAVSAGAGQSQYRPQSPLQKPLCKLLQKDSQAPITRRAFSPFSVHCTASSRVSCSRHSLGAIARRTEQLQFALSSCAIYRHHGKHTSTLLSISRCSHFPSRP